MEQMMQIGLTVSFLLHAAVLLVMSGMQHAAPPRPLKEVEVSYVRPAQRPQPPPPPSASVAVPMPRPPAVASLGGRARPSPGASASALLEPHAAQTAAVQKLQLPDTIDLSNLTQLSKNAVVYVDYFQLLRERIRQAAMRRYPLRNTQGEVFLTFTVTADGQVPEAHIVEEQSTPEVALRAASLESLRDAAPFPPFPKTLNRPRMTFRIIISYEVSEE